MAERKGLWKSQPFKDIDCLTGANGPLEPKSVYPGLSNRDGPPQIETAVPVGAGNGGGYIEKLASNPDAEIYSIPESSASLPDLSDCPLVEWSQFSWLLSQGVPAPTLVDFIMDLRVVRGVRDDDGIFEHQSDGRGFLAFEQFDDTVFWCPATGELATWRGHAFALGEDNIVNAITYSFDNYLSLHPSPIEWLRDRCRGIVVLNWNLAFDLLRDAPRVAVAEAVLPLYRKHMKPSRLPALSVLASGRSIAA